jgi:hypothetical protein
MDQIEMTFHTNKSLLKVSWINFDPVQGLTCTMYPVLSCEQNKAMDGWLIYSRIINEFEIALSVSPCNKVL